MRANLMASQIERHQPFGGVVPEIASREHLQHLFPLVERREPRADPFPAPLVSCVPFTGFPQ
ncbi:MAG: hypothetical protein ACXW5U_01505 [Thermoanaerobaculia bacterium]